MSASNFTILNLMNDLQKILDVFSEKFEHIVPDPVDAKVIFSLFINFKEHPEKNSYSELEIKEVIRKFQRESVSTEREQRQKIEQRLQTLLRQQFVDRNKERNIVLSDYSLQLCTLFLDKIQPLLNPSEIEKTLEDVRLTLHNRLNSFEDFKHWYENHFLKTLKTQLANQTNALDYQVSFLENDLNEKFKTMPFVELVDYFNKQMDVVISERRKLTKSFNGLDSIVEILTDSRLNKLNNMDFIQIKSNLGETFEYYRYKLEKTEEKIGQIKRIANGIFDKIDKKPFYRKLETFFYKVLSETTSEKKYNRMDKDENLYFAVEIKLPELPTISFIKDAPEFTFYPEFYDNFSLSKNQKTDHPLKNKSYLDQAAEKSRRRQAQAKRIQFWFGSLKENLKTSPEIDYSAFYMNMLHSESLETAIKGTEYILRRLRKEKYVVEATNDLIVDSQNPNIAIWNIKIKKPCLA